MLFSVIYAILPLGGAPPEEKGATREAIERTENMDKGKSKGSERAVPFHIARMPQALKAALAVEAGYMGMSMAEVARIAIAKLIKEKEAERRAAALLKAGRTTEA